jgi:glycosyltransferase involved in cell wall biosynthesis
MKNIWYFSHYAGGPGVGRAMRAYCLSKQWSAMGISTTIFVARHHHLLFDDGPLPNDFTIDSVKYVSLAARPYSGNGLGRILNMLDYCQAIGKLKHSRELPDVIIVSSPHPFGIFPARKLAKKFAAKLAFEVRDIWPLSITELTTASRLHPFVLLTGYAERYAYRHADVVASLLRYAEPHMHAKGMDPRKFIWVPNGIDSESPSPGRPTTETGRAAADLIARWRSEGRKVIIHPGSQGPPNALDRLIAAAKQINESFGLLLVGSGSETETLKESAKGFDSIAFFPVLPKEEALWLTKNSDIGYAGGSDLPLYRYGTSFNKVVDFVQFGIPFVETIRTGMGRLAKTDSPHDIADAIREELRSSTRSDISRHKEMLDYRAIATRYMEALSR